MSFLQPLEGILNGKVEMEKALSKGQSHGVEAHSQNASPITTFKEKEEEKDNIVKFEPKLITGGKEPPTGDTWLERLEIGTVFYAQSKNNSNDFSLPMFMLAGWEGKAAVLKSKELPEPFAIDPNRFCNIFRMFGIVAHITAEAEAEEQKEIPNGNGDRIQE